MSKAIDLQHELDKREGLLKQLTEECAALRVVLAMTEPPITPVGAKRNLLKRALDGEPATLTCACGRSFGRPQALALHRKACDAAKKITPAAPPKRKTQQSTKLRCPAAGCTETFETARGLGIHQTRMHYGERSISGSSIGGI